MRTNLFFDIECSCAWDLSGTGMGARIAFEDAQRLTRLLKEAFSSETPETALRDAMKR